MKLHELAKKTGIELSQLKEELGLTSHLSNVSEDIVARYIVTEEVEAEEQVKEVTEEIVAEPVIEENIPSKEEIELSCRCLGNKSPLWKYKNLLEV